VIARSRKKKNRKGTVQFINASDLLRKGRNQNTLEPDHVERIFHLYTKHEDVDLYSRIVSLEEIRKNDSDLSPSKYVTKHVAEVLPSVDESMATLREAAKAVKESEQRVLELLANRGLLRALRRSLFQSLRRTCGAQLISCGVLSMPVSTRTTSSRCSS
jgi:type I restriction enzyme M protein